MKDRRPHTLGRLQNLLVCAPLSTRRVTDVMEKMCGLSVSSTQVSRVAQILDEELEKWRDRELTAVPYPILDAHYEKVGTGGPVRPVLRF